jgi:uncharacterized surface protein with fasciclin (FAS1) repeats
MTRRGIFAAATALGFAAGCASIGGEPDIVAIASTNDQFSTLVSALTAADLVDTLQGPGPFTVFAPSNAAFDRLPAGTVDTLLLPENQDQLIEVLTYHVVPGRITSDQLSGEVQTVETVQGGTVTIDGTSGVTVDGANVTAADIVASNGVIHRIDEVLMP